MLNVAPRFSARRDQIDLNQGILDQQAEEPTTKRPRRLRASNAQARRPEIVLC
jgi:hypothetical protein